MPVPKRISNGSSVGSSPSSMSDFRLDLGGAGNLCRVLAEMNEGNNPSSEAYSGFVKSGAVQMRDWASTSGDKPCRDGLKFRRTSSVGAVLTEMSSGVPGGSPIWDADDVVAKDRDKGGVSKNGSLGALGRLARVFVAIGGEVGSPGLERSGCDCAREWEGKAKPSADTLDDREFGDRASSNPSTW